MGLFNFFGENEHRVFNYKPIYYDPAEEERKRRFGAVDGTMEKEKEAGTYVPGSYIRGSFRNGNYARRDSGMNSALRIIGIIGLILLALVLIYLCKFFFML